MPNPRKNTAKGTTQLTRQALTRSNETPQSAGTETLRGQTSTPGISKETFESGVSLEKLKEIAKEYKKISNVEKLLNNLAEFTQEDLSITGVSKAIISSKKMLKILKIILEAPKQAGLTNAYIDELITEIQQCIKEIKSNRFVGLMFNAAAVFDGITKIIDYLNMAKKPSESAENLEPNPYMVVAGYTALIMFTVLTQIDSKIGILETATKLAKNPTQLPRQVLSSVANHIEQYIQTDVPRLTPYVHFINQQYSTINNMAKTAKKTQDLITSLYNYSKSYFPQVSVPATVRDLFNSFFQNQPSEVAS